MQAVALPALRTYTCTHLSARADGGGGGMRQAGGGGGMRVLRQGGRASQARRDIFSTCLRHAQAVHCTARAGGGRKQAALPGVASSMKAQATRLPWRALSSCARRACVRGARQRVAGGK